MRTHPEQAIPKHRIALYGGAFDPVHNAHIAVARAALQQARLDRVVFIPSAQSPLKKHGPRVSAANRLEMLRLASANEGKFAVDDTEIGRGGVSYSIDTVRAFTEREPVAELFWVIGADQLAKLNRWRRIDDLIQQVAFLVLARPGYEVRAPDIDGLVWQQIDAPLMTESSTAVRERISSGHSLEGLVPSAVEAFIQKNGLYT